ncbi:MAG: hypothetical protein WCJ03_04135 [Bacteroidales bacterium]
MNLYLFNPDHDLALANGDENFNSPQSARTFAKDLACLPMWYAEPESVVLGAMPYRDWMEEMTRCFPQLSAVAVTSKPDFAELSDIRPWGWNGAIAKSLALKVGAADLIPTSSQIIDIRNLSHRATAIRAMDFLWQDSTLTDKIPILAQLISIEDVVDFVSRNPKAIFKAPWSNSGKGLCWVSDGVTDSVLGWCRNVVEKQGTIVAEKVYDKVQDFAMEFLCEGGAVRFAGYSLFQTERGIYRCNELMSDAAIVETLTNEWISKEFLLAVQNRLKEFILKEIAPLYNGYLGVDMFIYTENNQFRLHSCVEINLRMTMGMVARIFFDRFVEPNHFGKFYIDHFPSVGDLLSDHQQLLSSQPLQVEGGRIAKGYLSLSPISKNSHYRARVEIG